MRSSISAGSGAQSDQRRARDSPGVTEGVARDTIVVDYNDLDGVWSAYERHGEQIAAC